MLGAGAARNRKVRRPIWTKEMNDGQGILVERRLAAILAAAVAGYSRLMGADEEGTHERLKAHFGQLVDPKIKEHRGRSHRCPVRQRRLLPPGN
jgi:class 3 adenylate cyclase